MGVLLSRFLTKSPARATPQVFQPPKRLPTINYALLKDNDLRRKLRELGIPDWGGKPLLQKRHTEWLSLWNANCDAFAPKSKRELLRELDVWERTQGGQASAGPNVVMRKDFDGSAWSAAYGDDFKKLIADARKKSVKAPTRPAPTEEVPAEADTTEMTGTRAIEQAGLQADPVSVEQVCVGAETTNTRMMDQAELQPEGRSEAQEHPPLPLEELPPNDPDSGYQPVKSSGDGDQNRKHSQDSMILETESPVIIVEDAMA
jgi:E3 ubiquitin-protein ligase RAD18